MIPHIDRNICINTSHTQNLKTVKIPCLGCTQSVPCVNWLQYDVELYQRIEHLIGKKLPLYKTEEEEVMCLQERVDEARRVAKMVSTTLDSWCLLVEKRLGVFFR